jgi:hypothetical protein
MRSREPGAVVRVRSSSVGGQRTFVRGGKVTLSVAANKRTEWFETFIRSRSE